MIDNKDNLHIIWRSQNYFNELTQIYYITLNDNKWSELVVVSQSANYQFFPSITIDDVIWRESKEKYDFPKERPRDRFFYFSYLVADNFFNQYKEIGNIPVIYFKGMQLLEIIFG